MVLNLTETNGRFFDYIIVFRYICICFISKNITMDKILNRICSIENHPISTLGKDFRIKYVKGLGAIALKENVFNRL